MYMYLANMSTGCSMITVSWRESFYIDLICILSYRRVSLSFLLYRQNIELMYAHSEALH